MKKSILLFAALAAATALHADESYVWKGGDGKWSEASNWTYTNASGDTSEQSPGASPSVPVTISGNVSVEFDYGANDFTASALVTISGGATLTQTLNKTITFNGGLVLDNGQYIINQAWAVNLGGTVEVKNGGKIDISNCTGQTKVLTLTGTMTISKNGSVLAQNVTHSGDTSKIVLDGGTCTFSETMAPDARDEFKSGTFALSGGNYEFQPSGSFENEGVNITCWTFAPAANTVVTFKGGSLTLTRTTVEAYYQNTGVYINLSEGSTAQFTLPNASFANSSLYTYCFGGDSPRFRHKGEVLSEEVFNESVEVVANSDGTTTFYLAPDTDWKIGTLTASDKTASSATISATLTKTDGTKDYSVYVAYSTDEITADNIVSKGAVVTKTGDAYTKSLTGLTEDSTYNYAFAIVVDGTVEAFKADSFVASDFDYICKDGVWVGGTSPTENLNNGEKVLVVGTLDKSGWYVNSSGGKKFKDAVATLLGLQNGNVALELCNSSFTSTRTTEDMGKDTVAYAIYNCNVPLNFTSLSGDGVVRRGSSYICYATEEQCGTVYEKLFNYQTAGHVIDKRKVQREGADVTEEDFKTYFTTNAVASDKTITVDEQSVALKQLTITCWDTIPADALGAWTLQDGARARLVGKTKIGALTVESGDAAINLNGNTLTVSALTVNGEAKKGTYTAADSASLGFTLTGEGSLVVGQQGLVIILR